MITGITGLGFLITAGILIAGIITATVTATAIFVVWMDESHWFGETDRWSNKE